MPFDAAIQGLNTSMFEFVESDDSYSFSSPFSISALRIPDLDMSSYPPGAAFAQVTNSDLDMAINESGFFALNESGVDFYSPSSFSRELQSQSTISWADTFDAGVSISQENLLFSATANSLNPLKRNRESLTDTLTSVRHAASTYGLGLPQLPQLDREALVINGVPITMPYVTDVVSLHNNASSAITLVDAINNNTGLHQVVATSVPAVVDLGVLSNICTTLLTAGNLVINGFDYGFSGPDTATVAGWVNFLNMPQGQMKGVIAYSPDDQRILLKAIDGRNICLETNGVAVNATVLPGFSINSGRGRVNCVAPGNIVLSTTGEQGISIGGYAPEEIGFMVGTRQGRYRAGQ